MVLNIGRTYNLPAVALRSFNIYGSRQSLSNPCTGVAAIFTSRIKNGHPLHRLNPEKIQDSPYL